MTPLYDGIEIFVFASSSLGIFLNVILLYIARHHSQNLGSFKYLIMYFACLEAFYAIVNLLTMPICIVIGPRILVFSHDALLSNTRFANLGVGLYCGMYFQWLIVVVVMFLYKYISVCRLDWARQIKGSRPLKGCIFVVYIIISAYWMNCGTYLWTRDFVPESVLKIMAECLDINVTNLGYFVTGLLTVDDDLSIVGSVALTNHMILISIAASTIILCGLKLWKTILSLSTTSKEYKLNKQVFISLCMQAFMPLVLYQVPIFIILLNALFIQNDDLGYLAAFLSACTSVPKVLDPLIVLIVIRDYRRSFLNCIKRNAVSESHRSSSDGNIMLFGAIQRTTTTDNFRS